MNTRRFLAGRALLPAFWALVCTLAWAVAPANAATQTFTYTGAEQTFTVPAGVTSVHVVAVGGSGGTGQGGAVGGAAALVSADLVVSPGQVLYVEVAANGEFGQGGAGTGGFNGGAAGGGGFGGGGGGASDVRSSLRSTGLSPDPRLIVAAGGGGGGGDGTAGIGGNGGAAGTAGADDAGGGGNGGGGAGTASMGGASGIGNSGNGDSGQLGLGGAGAYGGTAGGGGAGGYYGGGGGGSGFNYGGGGGGGGSSLVPAGGSQVVAAAAAQPRVEITYTPPSTPTPVTDTVAPNVLSFGLANSTIRAAGRGGSIARAPIGTSVSYRLSEAATARFTVQRAAKGRRRGRRCVAPNARNRRARRCTRYLGVRGSFSHAGQAGLNRFRFTGRLRGRKLRPGRYRLILVATDAAGNKSLAKRARFRVVRR